MKPSVIAMVVIGNILPSIVKHCIAKNSLLCKNNDMALLIHQPIRDKTFKTTAIQAEYEKLKLLSTCNNILVTDWDIELNSIPNLRLSNYPYCGKWPDFTCPDGFIIYSNSINSCAFFFDIFFNLSHRDYSNIVNPAVIHHYLKKRIAVLKEYPSNLYHHYGTRCSAIKKDLYQLDNTELENIDITCKKRNGEKWPELLLS